ncbi:hypothetical protein L596_012106 [Steinernema carpocapsae]|uniref:Uncharacterized protein n=1 Tax=Steinernema carpocapsae TaxID=34508 RepID=A0A4V6A4P3_STECR|nr:hypothetical protein L596_012106 [Steinernema carpocapsae]
MVIGNASSQILHDVCCFKLISPRNHDVDFYSLRKVVVSSLTDSTLLSVIIRLCWACNFGHLRENEPNSQQQTTSDKRVS